MNEKYVDRAIRQALGPGQAGSEGACPDYNQLAAYLENRLQDHEKTAFESHAAGCAICQQALALAISLDEEPAAATPVPSYSSKRLLFRISIPVSAFALIFAAIAIGVLFMRYSRQPIAVPPPVQTAELRAPGQTPASSPEKISRELGPPAPLEVPKPSPAKAVVGQVPEAEVKKEAATKGEAQIQALPAAIVPTAASEIAERPAGKVEAQPLAAAKMEFAAARTENVSADQVPQAKGAAGGFAGGVVGGVIGGVSRAPRSSELQKVTALSMPQTPRDAILESSREQGEGDASRWKKVGDRSFRFASGYWIDEQCAKNANADLVEIKAGATEFEEILKLYPSLRNLRPAMIYWNEKIWLLR